MTHKPEKNDTPPYLDAQLPWEERADDLISRLTLEEKVSQMVHAAEGIERLGIPPYNWWNECLHGVGRAGVATVFPQAIGMAATWDAPLIAREAQAISDEARAKHHEALRRGIHDIYTGLTFWSPNINLFLRETGKILHRTFLISRSGLNSNPSFLLRYEVSLNTYSSPTSGNLPLALCKVTPDAVCF